jgi:hypothetical protein
MTPNPAAPGNGAIMICFMLTGFSPAGPVHRLLVSAPNRPKDIQLWLNVFSATIPPPAGLSDDDFIGRLIDADARYPDNLPYAWFPLVMDGTITQTAMRTDFYTSSPAHRHPGRPQRQGLDTPFQRDIFSKASE